VGTVGSDRRFSTNISLYQKRCKILSYYWTLIGTHVHCIERRNFQWPWVTPNCSKPPLFHIFIARHIYVVCEDREFKFGRVPRPWVANHSWKGRSQVRSREPFKFWWALTIFLEWLKLEWSNFVHGGCVKSQHKNDKMHGQGRVTHFKFLGPNDISAMAKARMNCQLLHTSKLYQILA